MPSSTKWFLKDAASSLSISGQDVHTLESTAGSAVVGYIKATLAGPVTPPTTATQWTKASGGTIAVWVTDPVQSVTFTSGTNVTFNLWALESASQANATITAELVRLSNDGTTVLTTLASCVQSRTELTTSSAVQNWTASIGSTTTLTTGDRLAVRCYVDDGSGVTMASGRTVTMNIGGGTTGASGDSYVTLPVSITTFKQANVTATDSLTFSDDLNAYAVVKPVVQATLGKSLSASSLAVSFTNNNTAGNAIAVVIGYANGANTVSSVTDSHSNTYHLAVAHAESTASHGFAAIYYATGIAAGANTVTVNISASDILSVAIYEISSVSVLDVTGTADGTTGSGVVSTSTATAVNNEVIIAGIYDWNSVTSWAADSAYHLGPSLNSTEFGNSVAFATDYSVSNTAGTQTTTFTGTATYFSAVIASFKGASSSANVTATDTLSFSDGLQRGIGRTAGDTLSYSDTLSRGTASSRTVSDTFTFSESQQRGIGRTASDTTSFSESNSRSTVASRSLSDTVSFSESLSRATAAARTLSDALSFSESIVSQKGIGRTATDSFTTSDSVSRALQIARTITDTQTFSDSVSRTVAIAARLASDTLALSEQLQANIGRHLSASDALSFSESLQTALGHTLTATDSFTTSDSVSRAIAVTRAATETLSLVETLSRAISGSRSISDSLSFSDTANTQRNPQVTANDTLAFSETLDRLTAVARPLIDTFGFTESVARLLALNLLVQESFSQSDSASGVEQPAGVMIIGNLKVIAACIVSAASVIEAATISTVSIPEGAKIDSAEIKTPQITGVTVNNSSKIDSAEIVQGAVITDVSVKD